MTAPDFSALGITDRCSRCGRPYDEHPHAYGDDCEIGNPHAFRSQPIPFHYRAGEGIPSDGWLWPDGHFPSWTKEVPA